MVVLVLVGAVILAACSSDSAVAPDADDDEAAPTTATLLADPDDEAVAAPEPDPAAVERLLDELARLDGRLAIGSGGRLATARPDGSDVVWLEDDDAVVAAQPTWSRDGSQLVYSRTTADDHTVIVHEVESGRRVESALPGPSAFYFQWSADAASVAYLRNSPGGEGVELGVVVPGGETGPLAVTAPFFVAWSPEAPSALAAHVGGRQVVLLSAPTESLGGGESVPAEVLLEPTAGFSTPGWIDEATLLVASEAGIVRLDVATAETTTAVSVDSPPGGPIQFVVSPDGSRVAYQIPALRPGLSVAALPTPIGAGRPSQAETGPIEAVPAEGGLVVVDLATGTSTVVSTEIALRWEWSPDSRRLAWLTPILDAAEPLVRWSFWEQGAADEPITVDYVMSDAVRFAYLPFFEQYAQSVSGWSADGAAFAFAGRLATEEVTAADSVWVHLLGAGAAPVRVAEGDVVAWSR